MFAGPRPLRPVFDTANGEQNDDERYWNRMKVCECLYRIFYIGVFYARCIEMNYPN